MNFENPPTRARALLRTRSASFLASWIAKFHLTTECIHCIFSICLACAPLIDSKRWQRACQAATSRQRLATRCGMGFLEGGTPLTWSASLAHVKYGARA
jgi:hypothetical protein